MVHTIVIGVGSNSSDETSVTVQDMVFVHMSSLATEDTPGLLIRAIALIAICSDDHYLLINNTNTNTSTSTNSRFILHDTDNKFNMQVFCSKYSKQHIQQFIRHVRVKAYGDGPLKTELIELSRLYGVLSDNDKNNDNLNIISFHDTVTNQTELASILKHSDYLVTTSLTAEVLNTFHIKSLMMLTPVISFYVGSNVESTLYAYENTILASIRNNAHTNSSGNYNNSDNINIFSTTRSILIENMSVFHLADELLVAFINNQKEYYMFQSASENTSNNNNEKYYFACRKRKDIMKKLTVDRHVENLYQGLIMPKPFIFQGFFIANASAPTV